jgi:membrane protein required for colicin V production
MGLAGIDVVFMVIIAVSALRCAARGFISEILSMAALIFGMLAALLFFRGGALFIREWFMPDVKIVPEIIAFVALFLAVYIIVKIVEITLKNIIEGIRLGSLDHLLGFFVGCVEGIVVVCLILFLINIQPFVDSNAVLERSILAKILLPLIIGDKKVIMESVVRLEMPGGSGV